MRNTSENSENTTSGARGGPQSVGRIFSILDSLADVQQGATLSELAASTGAPKTSLVGLLSGLLEEGCLIRDASSRYFLGPRFISLAMRASAGRDFIRIVRPVLEKLAEDAGETAVIGSLVPDEDLGTYLDTADSSNPIRFAVKIGERRELFCTAMGKMLLAYFEPERLKRYLKSVSRTKFTDTTITGMKDLQAELVKTREEGISRTKDERIVGASGLASPIFSPNGEVNHVILIAGPSDRVKINTSRIEPLVKAAAAECTRLTGGTLPNHGETTE